MYRLYDEVFFQHTTIYSFTDGLRADESHVCIDHCQRVGLLLSKFCHWKMLLTVRSVFFVGSTIISFCLRSLELQHTKNWRAMPLLEKVGNKKRRNDDHNEHPCCQCQCGSCCQISPS